MLLHKCYLFPSVPVGGRSHSEGVGWQPPQVEGSLLGQNHKKSCYCDVPGKEARVDDVPCLFQQLPSTLPSLPGQHQECLYSCPGGVPAETAARLARFGGILTPSQAWTTSWLQPKNERIASQNFIYLPVLTRVLIRWVDSQETLWNTEENSPASGSGGLAFCQKYSDNNNSSPLC